MTGVYEETHGIVSNSMWDPVLRKNFSVYDRSSHTIDWFGQNKLVEPIWVTNQKAGNERRSAAGWPGSNVVIQNQVIIDMKYNEKEKFKDLVDKVIALFVNEHAPVNFAALYLNEPDMTGHKFGPDSREMKVTLMKLDCVMGYLIEQLKSHHLIDKLNVIVTSDHGMVKLDSAIYLDSYIDMSTIDVQGSYAGMDIFFKNRNMSAYA